MPDYSDRFWTSRDGLKLHFRDYPGGQPGQPPLLCLPGLTRNARDFEDLANRLAPRWRVLCPDLRGRGDSEYAKDAASYNPLQYADDIEALVEAEALGGFVVIGTSLGGLLTMLLAARGTVSLKGAILNDVGPELDPAGIERIRGYVGQGRNFPTWIHAARALEEVQAECVPHFEIGDWLAMAKRGMVVGSNGRIHFDYDMKIAEPFGQPDPNPAPDLWPAFEALAGRPVLLLRGALSDLLAADVHAKMAQRLAGAAAITVAGVGHAPTLAEPEALAAIDVLLARVASTRT